MDKEIKNPLEDKEMVKKWPKVKSFIWVLGAITVNLQLIGFDVEPIMTAKRDLILAEIDIKKRTMEFEFELMRQKALAEFVPTDYVSREEFEKRIMPVEHNSHPPGKKNIP